jgi:hypothetical protein
MDYDLWLRLLRVGPSLQLQGPPLALIRDHAGTKTRRLASKFVLEFIRCADRYFAQPGALGEAIRKRTYARLYYSAAEAALLVDKRPGLALRWFLRSVRQDPKLLLRVPRALAKAARSRAASRMQA